VFYTVAADVKALYPSLYRDTVKKALECALEKHSDYSAETREIITELNKICLNNVVTQYGNQLYIQKNGIITGNNHPVSLANIAVHYILELIADVLNEAELFRRFIDDIIWISASEMSNERIGQALTSAFESSGLELTFRQACTAEKTGEVEFLDVNHCVTIEDDFGFVTKDVVKPTAEGRQFINGNSHHPQTTFKSIPFGEALRLRRLNQRKDYYLSSLNRLKEKAIRSKFPLNMTNDMIALASNWEDRPRPPKCDKKEDPQVWVRSFLHLLTLAQKEKKLSPKPMITYKRPTTIGQMLTNYKDLASNKTRKQTKGGPRPCEHCALCVCCGKNSKSMVTNISQLLTKTKTFKLNQSLTCADFGIYVATCAMCHEQMLVKLATNFPSDGRRPHVRIQNF